MQLSHVWDVFRDEVEKIDIKDLWIIGKNLKHYFAHLRTEAWCAVWLRGVVCGLVPSRLECARGIHWANVGSRELTVGPLLGASILSPLKGTFEMSLMKETLRC